MMVFVRFNGTLRGPPSHKVRCKRCHQGILDRTRTCKSEDFLYNVRDMNLEQVARRAKVSTATVSRVLNNASVVKTSTRARVVKSIEELKYHPNLQSRNR